MSRKRLIWELYPSYLLIIGISLLVFLWFGERHLAGVAFSQKALDLEGLARVAGRQVVAHPIPGDSGKAPSSIDDLCKELGGLSSARLTVVLPAGEVIGDSEGDPATMDNHADRPEIKAALAAGRGSAVRASSTLRRKMMYVAVTEGEGEGRFVMRAAVPVAVIEGALRTMQFRVVQAAVIIVILGGGLTLMIFRRIVRPLEEMRRGAERFARGDLESRVPVPGTEELGRLADAMNVMASQLDERIKAAVHEKNEAEAVLTSMLEGVVAVDTEKHIISLNRAAVSLLGVESPSVEGKSIYDVVRNTALLDFIAETLAEEKAGEREITLQAAEEKVLQVHGTMLRDEEERSIGALVVLNDVTRIRHLESVRREFVLNASHEIRTPVTSIKGFVETLLDGALDDRENVERFLGIIARHADRLNAIVEDLLDLSRIEREAEQGEISTSEEFLGPVIEEALEVCRPAAMGKKIALVQVCGAEISARLNPSLVIQAVINLVDNAIKYSDPGKAVEVSCGTDGPWITIRVRDEGCGIAEHHLPRLFERFYRVDKARSRSLGGTGLGLAIVKHIVQAHRGSVIVESELGEGTSFTLFLPGSP
jgi:two-component system phosphate regulon sensor histidine kinase PhoR